MYVTRREGEPFEDGRAWRRIRGPDGLEGRVATDLLAPVGVPAPAAIPAGRPTAAGFPETE